MGFILPIVQILLKYKSMLITGLEMPINSKQEDVEHSIENCIEISWVEDEMEKWITKQMIPCIKRRDDDRASRYEQGTWESFKRRRFFDDKIDRASEELTGLMGGRGDTRFLGLHDASPCGWAYVRLEKPV